MTKDIVNEYIRYPNRDSINNDQKNNYIKTKTLYETDKFGIKEKDGEEIITSETKIEDIDVDIQNKQFLALGQSFSVQQIPPDTETFEGYETQYKVDNSWLKYQEIYYPAIENVSYTSNNNPWYTSGSSFISVNNSLSDIDYRENAAAPQIGDIAFINQNNDNYNLYEIKENNSFILNNKYIKQDRYINNDSIYPSILWDNNLKIHEDILINQIGATYYQELEIIDADISQSSMVISFNHVQDQDNNIFTWNNNKIIHHEYGSPYYSDIQYTVGLSYSQGFFVRIENILYWLEPQSNTNTYNIYTYNKKDRPLYIPNSKICIPDIYIINNFTDNISINIIDQNIPNNVFTKEKINMDIISNQFPYYILTFHWFDDNQYPANSEAQFILKRNNREIPLSIQETRIFDNNDAIWWKFGIDDTRYLQLIFSKQQNKYKIFVQNEQDMSALVKLMNDIFYDDIRWREFDIYFDLNYLSIEAIIPDGNKVLSPSYNLQLLDNTNIILKDIQLINSQTEQWDLTSLIQENNSQELRQYIFDNILNIQDNHQTLCIYYINNKNIIFNYINETNQINQYQIDNFSRFFILPNQQDIIENDEYQQYWLSNDIEWPQTEETKIPFKQYIWNDNQPANGLNIPIPLLEYCYPSFYGNRNNITLMAQGNNIKQNYIYKTGTLLKYYDGNGNLLNIGSDKEPIYITDGQFKIATNVAADIDMENLHYNLISTKDKAIREDTPFLPWNELIYNFSNNWQFKDSLPEGYIQTYIPEGAKVNQYLYCLFSEEMPYRPKNIINKIKITLNENNFGWTTKNEFIINNKGYSNTQEYEDWQYGLSTITDSNNNVVGIGWFTTDITEFWKDHWAFLNPNFQIDELTWQQKIFEEYNIGSKQKKFNEIWAKQYNGIDINDLANRILILRNKIESLDAEEISIDKQELLDKLNIKLYIDSTE